ncbi:FAD-dependent oxidoreductase [Sinomonas halotolerans]|uniref:FAD-dependent oxidoreductase n=1 Tax=Sinomonas halotolerans TaxID=1644133 RepID=A0ABU9X2T6_9MICC
MRSLWQDRAEPLGSDELHAGAHYDAVVAGAGITGLTAAVLLARAGRTVAVVEARRPGALTTGGTTGKVSLLQGSMLSTVRQHHNDDVLRAYVQGNLEGQQWLQRYMDERGVPYQTRTAWTYAEAQDAMGILGEEHAACVAAGLDVTRADALELPFRTAGAIRLDGQVQVDAMDVLAALAAELRQRGGALIQGVRLTGADIARARRGGPVEAVTDHGRLTADRLILATGTPVLNRGARFALLEPSRAFAAAFSGAEHHEGFPQGMYLSLDSPSRSLRSVPPLPGRPEAHGADDGGPRLVAVGGGFAVGSTGTGRHRSDLLDWVRERFPGTRPTHVWAAQDYIPVTGVPLVGALPGTGGRIHAATGFGKWGLANGVAAALSISADILGGNIPWSRELYGAGVSGRDAQEAARFNAGVAGRLAAGWAKSLVAERHRPVGDCEVGGVKHRVSRVCTHLGGVLQWNDAEKTWDCPLHGSRFSCDGGVLEGPATKPLRRG